MNDVSKKLRLVSGVKPTGNVHLGNYFGAMRQFVRLQDSYDCRIFIADLHALNQIHNPAELRNNTLEIAKTYLAIGLDPSKVTLFKQSDVPLVCELCWIFNSITSMSLLERAHAYKDSQAKNVPVNMGLFDYPVLMAADILIYGADVVPVGRDQKQHLEMTVDIGQKFNHVYGEVFKQPKALIGGEVRGVDESEIGTETGAVVGLDGRKMSKSYNNVIGLFDSMEVLQKKVMSIKTDSRGANEAKDPETDTVYAFYSLVASPENLSKLKERYLAGNISYKESKELLLEELKGFLAPIQAKKAELDANPEYVKRVLAEGAEKAEIEAKEMMQVVREKVGLALC